MQRAHSLLEGFPLAAEHGWLALRDAEIALRRDTGEARRLAAEGAAIGRGSDRWISR